MIGQRHVGVAARLRRLRHVLDGRGAIGPIGMDMQIAADVVDADQTRQRAGLGERDLAAVLAHFRRDIGKAELPVDLFLGSAGDAPLARKQAIFVQFPFMVVGDAAQGDVMRLGAGKIEQRGAIALLGHRAHVDLDA